MARRRSQQPAAAQPPVVDANAANASSGYFFAGAMLLTAVLIPWYFELPLNFNVTDREFNPLVFVPHGSVQSSVGIPFAFAIPADALPSNGPPVYERQHGNVRWILTVTAPMPGVDYYAVFAIDMRR